MFKVILVRLEGDGWMLLIIVGGGLKNINLVEIS